MRNYPAPSLQDVRIVADIDSPHVYRQRDAGGHAQRRRRLCDDGSDDHLVHPRQSTRGRVPERRQHVLRERPRVHPAVGVFEQRAKQPRFSNTIGTGYGFVVAPTSAIALRLDNMVVAAMPATVPGHAEYSTVNFTLSTGTHKLVVNSDFQFAHGSDTGGTGMFAYYNPWRVAGCGDGSRTGTEACDDGNVTDGDGCSSVCGVNRASVAVAPSAPSRLAIVPRTACAARASTAQPAPPRTRAPARSPMAAPCPRGTEPVAALGGARQRRQRLSERVVQRHRSNLRRGQRRKLHAACGVCGEQLRQQRQLRWGEWTGQLHRRVGLSVGPLLASGSMCVPSP